MTIFLKSKLQDRYVLYIHTVIIIHIIHGYKNGISLVTYIVILFYNMYIVIILRNAS